MGTRNGDVKKNLWVLSMLHGNCNSCSIFASVARRRNMTGQVSNPAMAQTCPAQVSDGAPNESGTLVGVTPRSSKSRSS